jgi:hypothetical protein
VSQKANNKNSTVILCLNDIGGPLGYQGVKEHLPVHDNAMWLETGLLVEVDEGGFHHAGQAQDHVPSGLNRRRS